MMIECNNTQSGRICNATYYSLPNATGQIQFVDDLSYISNEDEAFFGVNVTVPIDEAGGIKTQTVTFEATISQYNFQKGLL